MILSGLFPGFVQVSTNVMFHDMSIMSIGPSVKQRVLYIQKKTKTMVVSVDIPGGISAVIKIFPALGASTERDMTSHDIEMRYLIIMKNLFVLNNSVPHFAIPAARMMGTYIE